LTTPQHIRIESRSNPALARVRKLLDDPGAYRRIGQVWLEGEHLLQSAIDRGLALGEVLIARSDEHDARFASLLDAAKRVLVVDDPLWRGLGSLPSPVSIAALLDLPASPAIAPGQRTVVLDRIQDAGNLGSILRSAAGFGVAQVLALKGCAATWSPKVMRAGMGAHFSLRLLEGVVESDLAQLKVALLATGPRAEHDLFEIALPDPCAWVFGHEGQGISPTLESRCALRVRIPQPGGGESLNAASAAAVCLYESMRQRHALDPRAGPTRR
jgi:RNA methyltransferase, TrmH family